MCSCCHYTRSLCSNNNAITYHNKEYRERIASPFYYFPSTCLPFIIPSSLSLARLLLHTHSLARKILHFYSPILLALLRSLFSRTTYDLFALMKWKIIKENKSRPRAYHVRTDGWWTSRVPPPPHISCGGGKGESKSLGTCNEVWWRHYEWPGNCSSLLSASEGECECQCIKVNVYRQLNAIKWPTSATRWKIALRLVFIAFNYCDNINATFPLPLPSPPSRGFLLKLARKRMTL
jgi:hypothetical protein